MCFVDNATTSSDGWPVVVGAPGACDPDVADVLAMSDPMPISAREWAELPAVADEAPGIVQGPIPSIIQEVVGRFGGDFPKEIPAGLPTSQPTNHRIDLVPDAVPPCHCIFRNCPEEEVELRLQIDEYLVHGWIEPAQSAFGAGVLFAKKHDATKRMCVDYRRLNDLTQKVVCPMPRIDECIDHVLEATVFTKMDLRSGFHQILVFPEHKERTAFQTRRGTFQHCVMPFGLCNAPATFSAP